MSTLLTVTVFTETSRTRVALGGELDLSTIDQLREELTPLLGTSEEIWLDLTDLRFMDSSGIHLMLESAAAARSNGGSLVIACPGRAVRRVFEAVELGTQLTIAETL